MLELNMQHWNHATALKFIVSYYFYLVYSIQYAVLIATVETQRKHTRDASGWAVFLTFLQADVTFTQTHTHWSLYVLVKESPGWIERVSVRVCVFCTHKKENIGEATCLMYDQHRHTPLPYTKLHKKHKQCQPCTYAYTGDICIQKPQTHNCRMFLKE